MKILIKPYRLLTLILVLLAPLKLSAQVLNNIKTAFNNYYGKAVQEKVFVHTDKDQYVSGEIMWFSAYNVDASSSLFIDLSKVAYVEILDASNAAVIQSKFSLSKGKGQGSLYLSQQLPSGNYKFRVYTKWMENYGANHFFEKTISIYNTTIAPEKTQLDNSENDIQFFPEGGDMVEGLPANIAFKASTNDGKGFALKGVIINEKNDTLARFQTLRFGMGQFKLTPQANQKYKFVGYTEKNEIIIKDLPTAKKVGYTIILDNNSNQLQVKTNTSSQNLHLVAHHNKTIAIAETASVTNGTAVFNLAKEKLAEGLSLLTIFNNEGIAVAERLYFKRPSKKLLISAFTDAPTYTPREAVTLDINTLNEQNKSIPTSFSVAVKQLDSLQGLDQNDIESYLWLSSELKGDVELPGYYFRNPNPETDLALNNLLLTQGWRRMKWNEVLNKKASFTHVPELNGHIIKGKINGGSPEQAIYLTVSNGAQQFYTSSVDSTNNFIFNTKDFYGPNEIIVQTNPLVDTTSKIAIQSPFSEQFTESELKEFNFKPSQLNSLRNLSLGTQIQNTYLSSELKKTSALGLDTAKFYGKAYRYYALDDYTRFNFMEEILREYVRETFIAKSDKKFTITVLSKWGILDSPPLVLVDGAPYFNMDRVMELDPKRLEKLAVVRDRYYYGGSSFEGILDFKSYKPKASTQLLNPNAIVLDYEGMQLQREFYSPQYDTESKKKNRIPDYRSLLLWSPQNTSSNEGEAKLKFYTGDKPGIYVVVINGLTENGVPGFKTLTFEVKP